MPEAYERGWSLANVSLTALAVARSGQESRCTDSAFGVPDKDLLVWEIPTFQRGLRWNSDKRADFYSSLFRGWPIGVLVLATTGDELLYDTDARRRTFSIIDGQQRTHAINTLVGEFWEHPWYELGNLTDAARRRDPTYKVEAPEAPFGASRDAESAIRDLSKQVGLEPGVVAVTFAELVAGAKGHVGDYLGDPQSLLDDLVGRTALEESDLDKEGTKEARRLIAKLSTAVQTQYSALKGVQIPVIIIRSGMLEYLPDIFQALNSGLPLKGYDLLAASWSSLKLGPDCGERYPKDFDSIASAAQSRIQDQYERADSYEYDPNIAELSDDELTLFDFLYGLSGVLVAGSSGTIVETLRSKETLAFQVAALIATGGITVNERLSSAYPYESGLGYPDIRDLPKYVLETNEQMRRALKQPMSVNVRKRSLGGQIGLVQAATYLAAGTVLTAKLSESAGSRVALGDRNSAADRRLRSDNSKTWSSLERRRAFKDRVPAWYLYDSLKDEFQGSPAHTNARGRVWHRFAEKGSRYLEENERMLSYPDLSATLRLLSDLFVREATLDRTPAVRRITDEASVVFRLAFGHLNIDGEDLDHVLPFSSRPAATDEGFGGAAPMNHVANWMPLESSLNGARGSKPWAEYFGELSEAAKKRVRARLFVEPASASASVMKTRAAMLAFLLARYKSLVVAVMEAIEHPDWIAMEQADRDALVQSEIVQRVTEQLALSAE